MAKIFKKETTRPLTNYQKHVNEEAGMFALSDPSLLCRRGHLLAQARSKVAEKGYTFVKGKSRSKRLASPDNAPRATRAKISADIRGKRILALEEDIANIDEQLLFKEKRRQQAEGIRNYKVCDQITEEIGIVKQQRRKLSNELHVYHEKERKAKWYEKAKQARKARRSSSTASNLTSDESDLALLSPASSVPSTSDSVREMSAAVSEGESEAVSDGEHNESDLVFHPGLPVEQQQVLLLLCVNPPLTS